MPWAVVVSGLKKQKQKNKNEKELIWAWMKWGFKIKLELVIGFLNFGLGLSGLVVSGLKQGNEMGFGKRKENSGRTGEKRRQRHYGEIASRRNFDQPFRWPNDLRFSSNFEEVLYSTRGTILRWPIVFLTVEFLDL